MRVHLKTTPSDVLVSYNYQASLVSSIHRWIGHNNIHNNTSLYSFSWLKGGKSSKKGINFKDGAGWFISIYDVEIVKRLVAGIQKDPSMAFGMEVSDLYIQETPVLANPIQRFVVASPVFIKRNIDGNTKFFYYTDEEASIYLTQSLQRKLEMVGIDDPSAKVCFDLSYRSPKTKAMEYKEISLKGSVCPIIVEGKPETQSFVWDVGVGNSTGIGFGSVNI